MPKFTLDYVTEPYICNFKKNPSHRIVCLPAFDATNSFDSLCWYFLYLIVRLYQNLVIFAECYQEHDGGDVFKAVDPLPSF